MRTFSTTLVLISTLLFSVTGDGGNGTFSILQVGNPSPVQTKLLDTTEENTSAPFQLAPIERKSSRQRRIFILSDSQGQTDFGTELQRQLLNEDFEVLYHAVKNGTPYHWTGAWNPPVFTRIFDPAKRPEEGGKWSDSSIQPITISDYVDTYDPDIFIIQAGTNFEIQLAQPDTSKITQLISKCARQATARKAKLLWIGPPDSRDDVKSDHIQQKAENTLRSALAEYSREQEGECFFDSRTITPMPNSASGDGEHPDPVTARSWAVKAAEWITISVRRFENDQDFSTRILNQAPHVAKPRSNLESFDLAMAEDSEGSKVSKYLMKLRLLSKSRIPDPREIEYPDAFSVFKYQLIELAEPVVGGNGQRNEIIGETDIVYILHWTSHNNGRTKGNTAISQQKEGSTVSIEVTPLIGHPLYSVLETMPINNDFDDLTSPIFLSTTFLDERNF